MKEHIRIAQLAEERKNEIESARNLPEDLIAQVKENGLVKMWASTNCGGTESSIWEVSEMIRSIAYHNGSLAWVVAVTGCSSLFSGFLPDAQSKLLFGDKHAMVGGFAGPSGMAILDDKDLTVTGRWSWGSGITHCSHIVGGVMVMENNKVKGTAVCFFKPEEITMIDNWHVLGLKGSHSIDYKVDSLTIPQDRWSWFPVKEPVVDAAIYRFSFLGALSISVASVGLGLAQRALDEIKKLAITKSPFGIGKPLAKKPEVQARIAEAEGNYIAAYSLMKETIAGAQKETLTQKCSIETKARIRLATAHTTKLCGLVVQESYRIGGGSSVWEKQKLEELLRDTNVVTQHGMVSYGNYRTAGAVLLGNEVPEMLL